MIHTVKRMSYLILLISYIADLFVHVQFLQYFIGCTIIFCITISIVGSGKLYKTISLLFLWVSMILFVISDISISTLLLESQSTVPVVSLLLVLPFINSIFRVGRYDKKLGDLLAARMDHYGQFYQRTVLVTCLMSVFLFFGSIPLVYQLIRRKLDNLPKHIRELFIAKGLLRGFSTAQVWSPMEILVVLTIEYNDVDYLLVLPFLLLAAIIYATAAIVRGHKFRAFRVVPLSTQVENVHSTSSQGSSYRYVVVLIIALFVLITSSLIFHEWLGIGFLSALTLTVVPFALIWSILIRKWKWYMRYSRLNWVEKADGLQNITLLFLSLGIFNAMVAQSGILGELQQSMITLGSNPIMLFLVIQAVILGLSFVGFHPLVTVSLVCLAVQPLIGEIPALSLAVSIITAGLSTASAGTYNTSVNVTADLLSVSPYRVTYWNLRFALFFGGVGTVIAYLITLY